MIIPAPAEFNFTIHQGGVYERLFRFLNHEKFKYSFNASASEVSGIDDYNRILTFVLSTDELSLVLNDEYLSRRFYTLTEPGTVTYPFVADDVLWIDKRSPLVLPTLTDVRMTLRRAYESTATLTLTLANGNFVVNSSSGQITLKITDEETESISVGDQFIYDLEAEEANGDVSKLFYGVVDFQKETTYV